MMGPKMFNINSGNGEMVKNMFMDNRSPPPSLFGPPPQS